MSFLLCLTCVISFLTTFPSQDEVTLAKAASCCPTYIYFLLTYYFFAGCRLVDLINEI